MSVSYTKQLERIRQSGQATKIVQQVAELAAQRIVRRFHEARPEWQDDYLPLDELVAWLGLTVESFHPNSRPAGTYGYVDSDESEHLIWLRRNLPDSIRRFTLAHELGHAVLHCEQTPQLEMVLQDMRPLLEMAGIAQTPPLSSDDPCHESDVEDGSLENEEQLQDRLGIGQQYDPRSLREQAANMFAAELLMPLERVRTLYLDAGIPPAMLSDAFGVSSSALLNRLANLLKPSSDIVVESQFIVNADSTQTGRKAFDEFQQAAIEAPTPALIIAGPGSGKTSTLIGRVEYLVQTLAVPPQHILALTFSRKAAQEMEERLLHLFADGHDESRHYSDGGSDKSSGPLPKVCTFHAFCADVLRRYVEQVGLRPDFGLVDEAESYMLLRQQSHLLNLRHYQRLQSPTAYFPDLLKAISRAKDELVTPEAYAQLAQRMRERAGNDEEKREQAERAAEVAHVYALYQQALMQRGDTDFGGLLLLTLQLFGEHPAILREQQQQYQHILVDEFQDVNRASGVLLRVLAGAERRVWVVGDTNQAIYRFRGASPANMSHFTRDFPGAAILPLTRNYRSRPDLVRIAESFRCKQLELGEEPGKNEPTRLTLDDTSITIAHAVDEASEIQGIAHDIQTRHANGYAYRDMAILCRTRAQVQKVSRVLVDMGIPIAERTGLLEQDIIKGALASLLLLTDASGSGLLRLPAEYALSQQDLETLLISAYTRHVPLMLLIRDGETPLTMSIEGRRTMLRLSTLLERLTDPKTVRGVWSLLARYLFIETVTIRNLLHGEQDKHVQEQLDDYDALLQLARHYDAQYERNSQQATSPSLAERAKGFLEYLRLFLLLRQEGAMRRSEQNEDDEQLSPDTLRIMTVHASKGLEFPVVYMPGLTAQRFPAMRRANPVPPPTGMTDDVQDDEQERGETEDTGETERQAHESGESSLFYVGVTRARDALILSYSDRYGKKGYKPSPYLDALRAGLSEARVKRLDWKFTSEIALPDEEDTLDVSNAGEGITERLSEEFLHAMLPQELRATDIEAYHRCPRQYAYSRLYHFDSEASGYQLFHRATQQAIEQLNKSEGTAGEEVDVRELYAEHWQRLGGDALPFATFYEQHGHQVLSAAQRALQMKRHEETWHTQYDVEIAGHSVQVTVDRVEKQSLHAAEPIEAEESTVAQQAAQITGATQVKRSITPNTAVFKRTRFGKRKDKSEPEMRDLFYTLAYRKQYPGQAVNLQHHNLSTGEATPLSMTPKKEQRLQAEAEQAIHGLEQHKYPAKPAEASECLACPFSFICPI